MAFSRQAYDDYAMVVFIDGSLEGEHQRSKRVKGVVNTDPTARFEQHTRSSLFAAPRLHRRSAIELTIL